ncbi:hypothetical protein YC2023_122579 [Brassica napus]
MRGELNFLYVYEETWDEKKYRRMRCLKPYKHNYSCNEQEEVGKTTDLANQVVDEITVRRLAFLK